MVGKLLSLSSALIALGHAFDITPTITIGGSVSKYSHLKFSGREHNMTSVSIHVTVENSTDFGLNYFALQVNFNHNDTSPKTWAHGGLQWTGGGKKANWGGLISRGGGSGDYSGTNPANDIYYIQSPSGEYQLGPYDWSDNKEYEIKIERVDKVTLPQCEYVYIGTDSPIKVSGSRVMYAYNLTISPVDGNGTEFQSTLYDYTDSVSYFTVWDDVPMAPVIITLWRRNGHCLFFRLWKNLVLTTKSRATLKIK